LCGDFCVYLVQFVKGFSLLDAESFEQVRDVLAFPIVASVTEEDSVLAFV
jgi:hypothetical protein